MKPSTRKTALVGIGLVQHKRGRSPVSEKQALVQAIVAACDDCGINPAEIDGFVTYGDDHNEPTRLMPELGTRELTWATAVFGGGGGGLCGALTQAAAAIESGQARVVVIYRALVQASSGRLSAAVMAHAMNDHFIAGGISAPAQICALRARRLFEHHGVPTSTVEAMVRASYHHAQNNPQAVAYGQPFDRETYQTSRMIAEPFRLFDCSRENDGAGAIIMVGAERAGDLAKRPVWLLASAMGSEKGWGELLENDVDYAAAGFSSVARRLYAQAGLTPADIDVAQIYDNFTAQGVASMIDHGFCTRESAAEVLTFENLIAEGGRLPINTAGGNIAEGFIHGIGMVLEGVRQLRGESCNPVAGARTCLIAGGPGAPLVSSAILGL